jgi:NAD(P)-dependent dehydrogenase (short-subunit alcohol dehydrogenase family)
MVTGAGRGFGRAMAYTYALYGAKVVAVALEENELQDLSNTISGIGRTVFTIATDLSDEDNIYDIHDRVLDRYGHVDTIVNNAAVCLWKRLEDTTVKDWDTTFAVNIRAPFLLSKAFSKNMGEQGGGSIISITSRSAEIGFIAEIAFSPTKWAIEGLTQCLAMELQPLNIAVNTLRVAAPPGKRLKPTGMTIEESMEQPLEIRDKYATDEGMAECFAPAWIFLATQNANGVTGQRLASKDLSDYIRENGWEAASQSLRRKLTKAVYVPYDFPESASYQTVGGGHAEQKFVF